MLCPNCSKLAIHHLNKKCIRCQGEVLQNISVGGMMTGGDRLKTIEQRDRYQTILGPTSTLAQIAQTPYDINYHTQIS